MNLKSVKIIAVDFDGTLCENNWPGIGAPNEELIEYLRNRKKDGDKLILWTCRVEDMLQKAVEWCKERNLVFDAVNENLPEIIENFGSDTRKIFANEYIDDRNIPLSSCREKSNTQTWAEKEVEIACENERKASGTKEGEWDYGCACYESALKAYHSLSEDGHSGFSIGMTKYILNRLIDGKPLTSIEDTEDVWSDITDLSGYRGEIVNYQCKRMSSLFKYVYSSKEGIWWQMIQLLPSSYNQKRTVMLNYETLTGVYPMLKNHELDEWVEFRKWIEVLPYSEIIIGKAMGIKHDSIL